MRRSVFRVGLNVETMTDFAVILDEIDSETGKVNQSSVVLVGFNSEEAAQKEVDRANARLNRKEFK